MVRQLAFDGDVAVGAADAASDRVGPAGFQIFFAGIADESVLRAVQAMGGADRPRSNPRATCRPLHAAHLKLLGHAFLGRGGHRERVGDQCLGHRHSLHLSPSQLGLN